MTWGGRESSWKRQCSFDTSAIAGKKVLMGIRMVVQKYLLVEGSTGGVVKIKVDNLMEGQQ